MLPADRVAFSSKAYCRGRWRTGEVTAGKVTFIATCFTAWKQLKKRGRWRDLNYGLDFLVLTHSIFDSAVLSARSANRDPSTYRPFPIRL